MIGCGEYANHESSMLFGSVDVRDMVDGVATLNKAH